jgi:hypothetical protein
VGSDLAEGMDVCIVCVYSVCSLRLGDGLILSDVGWSLLATPENVTGYGTISFQYAEKVLSNEQLKWLLI